MKNIECDKPLSNIIKIKGLGTERHMKEIKQDVGYGNRTIKLVMQFPDEAQDAAAVREEVKSILTCELRERIRHSTAV